MHTPRIKRRPRYTPSHRLGPPSLPVICLWSSTRCTLVPEKLLEAEYQPLVEAENLWKEEIPDETLQPSDKTVQAHWDAPLFTKKFDNLLEGMIQPADKARLRAVASDHTIRLIFVYFIIM